MPRINPSNIFFLDHSNRQVSPPIEPKALSPIEEDTPEDSGALPAAPSNQENPIPPQPSSSGSNSFDTPGPVPPEASISPINYINIQDVPIDRINELVMAFPRSDLKNLTKEQVGALSVENILELLEDLQPILHSLSKKQIQKIPPSHINLFCLYLPNEKICLLTKEQVQKLNIYNLIDALPHLGCEQVNWLTQEQIQAIPLENIAAVCLYLFTAQLQMLNKEQIQALSFKDIDQYLENLTPEQCSWINPIVLFTYIQNDGALPPFIEQNATLSQLENTFALCDPSSEEQAILLLLILAKARTLPAYIERSLNPTQIEKALTLCDHFPFRHTVLLLALIKKVDAFSPHLNEQLTQPQIDAALSLYQPTDITPPPLLLELLEKSRRSAERKHRVKTSLHALILENGSYRPATH